MWQVLSLWWEMSTKLETVWRNRDCIGLPGDQAAKFINQRIATVVSSTPNPALQIGGFGLTRTPQMPFVENFALIMLRNWSCNFKITFLQKFWRDWGFTWHRHGDIRGGLGASIFEVRNLTVWCQFQLKLDQVTCQKLIAACLVSFSMTHGSVYIFFKLLWKHLLWNLHFGTNYSHPIVHLFFFYK